MRLNCNIYFTTLRAFNTIKIYILLRAKNSFRAIGILIVEDFPVEVMERRKVFSPILKAAYNSDGRYRARLVVDKLLLNGI